MPQLRAPLYTVVLWSALTAAPSAGQQPAPAAPRPAPAPRQDALTVPFTQFTLPNGLHVILHEDHTVPLATVNVWYHVGSARKNRAAPASRTCSST